MYKSHSKLGVIMKYMGHAFSLCLCILSFSIAAQSNIDRAKTLVRGAQEYRKQTFPRLLEYLEIAGMGRWAQKLKDNVATTEQLTNDIETYLQQTLSPTEQELRATNKTALERQQIFMVAKTLDEINKLFNTLDNLMNNVAKEVRDYRQEQRRLEPVFDAIKQQIAALSSESKKTSEKIIALTKQYEPQLKTLNLDPQSPVYTQELTKRAPEILPLRTKLDQINLKIKQQEAVKNGLERQFLPKLKDYYNSMQKDVSGLFNQTKTLGTTMTAKAGAEQTLIAQYEKALEEQKTKYTNPDLLKKLEGAQKAYVQIMDDIQKEITTNLSDQEQRLWGILTDLYQRVLLTEKIILHGSTPIQEWTLPKIVGIKTPEELK